MNADRKHFLFALLAILCLTAWPLASFAQGGPAGGGKRDGGGGKAPPRGGIQKSGEQALQGGPGMRAKGSEGSLQGIKGPPGPIGLQGTQEGPRGPQGLPPERPEGARIEDKGSINEGEFPGQRGFEGKGRGPEQGMDNWQRRVSEEGTPQGGPGQRKGPPPQDLEGGPLKKAEDARPRPREIRPAGKANLSSPAES